MALLDWTKLNSSIDITYTKKKFYNNFLYKLTYWVPGVRLITWSNDPEHLKIKVDIWNDGNNKFRIAWRTSEPAADYTQLADFYNLYQNKNKNLRFRIERSTFNIYANTEQELYDISVSLLGNWSSSLREVSLVDPSDINLLNQGYTIVKKPPKYSTRVRIKEGMLNTAERQFLCTYLKNLDLEIKVSEHLLSRLLSNNKYFSGGYVYLNDTRIVEMLKLVAPTLIGHVDHMINQ